MMCATATVGSCDMYMSCSGWEHETQMIHGFGAVGGDPKGLDCTDKVDRVILCSLSQRVNCSGCGDLALGYVLGTTDSSFPQTFASFSWSGTMKVLVVPSTLGSRGTEERKSPDPYSLLSFDTGPSHPCTHLGANLLAVIPCPLFAVENY